MAVQHACPSGNLYTAEKNGHISQKQRRGILRANSIIDIDPGTPRYRSREFYMRQSKQLLGGEKDRVKVPIRVNEDSLRPDWLRHINTAISDINQAAPGLRLYKVSSRRRIKVRIVGIDECEAYTVGDILETGEAKIFLGHDFEDKKRTSVHELLHSLGFSHEHCRRDAGLYVTNNVSPDDHYWYPNYASDREIEGLTRFDPFSVMLYPEDEALQRNPMNDTVWELKPDTTLNRELSELNKVHLNLLYRPCKTTTYNPELSADTGVYYCGRRVMERHNYPAESTTDGRCGPNNWANCPACRTLRNPKVDKIIRSGKWQGWSGLFYCGRYFGVRIPGHDGYCGPNNGPPCPECSRLLYPTQMMRVIESYQLVAAFQSCSLYSLDEVAATASYSNVSASCSYSKVFRLYH